MLLALLLQDTPDTSRFLYIGFAFLIGLPLLYLASLAARRRNLEKDLEMVETLEAEAKSGVKNTPSARVSS
jgi:hypothetical protein